MEKHIFVRRITFARRNKLSKRGYTDSEQRIPPGWRVAHSDRWPINNPNSGLPDDFKIEDWRFRTLGEVENPLELTYQEFQNLPHVSKILDHHCVDGWSYLGQNWNGVDIAVIKEMARVRSSARYLIIQGIRGSSQRFLIDQDLLLADGQNGSTLSKATGYPLRVVAPGEFGFKSRKWINAIKFCAEREIDMLEKSFMQDGIYELYSDKVGSFNPWNVDSIERKKFLRLNFAADTARERQRKKELYSREDNNARLDGADSFRLCSLEELGKNAGLKVVANGNEIFLVRRGSEICAIEPICTHLGSDLSRGKFNSDAGTIKCALHGALFDVTNGKCLSGSLGCDGDTFPGVRTYKVKVMDGDVFVERNQDWGNLW